MFNRAFALVGLVLAIAHTTRADPVVDFYQNRVLRANWQGSALGCGAALTVGGLGFALGAMPLDAALYGAVAGVGSSLAWTHSRVGSAAIYLSLLEVVSLYAPKEETTSGRDHIHHLRDRVDARIRELGYEFSKPTYGEVRDQVAPFHHKLLTLDPSNLPTNPILDFVTFAAERYILEMSRRTTTKR